MNSLYLGVSGSGKTYQLRHIVLDELVRGKEVYVIGRPEEWSMFKDIHLLNVYNISKSDIDKLLSVTDSLVIVDSIEFIKDRDFIGDLCVSSRIKGNNLYISAFELNMLNNRVLININNLYLGYLSGYQSLRELENMFCIKIRNKVEDLDSHNFLKVV